MATHNLCHVLDGHALVVTVQVVELHVVGGQTPERRIEVRAHGGVEVRRCHVLVGEVELRGDRDLVAYRCKRLAVLLPANHRLAHLAAVTFADLAGETLLLQEHICLGRDQ